MHLFVSLGFYVFQSVFFATTYHMCFTHSSYFISGFGARNMCRHILVMTFNFILSRHHVHLLNIIHLLW